MPHPKRKISKSRRDKRRTHDNAVASTLYVDKASGEINLMHRVNPETGMYKGRKVMKGTKDEA
ncbi:MAG: 50S ribosomal protein L32 [Bacteroidia bacterium]|jgi:large subunit ribosomal protein L32